MAGGLNTYGYVEGNSLSNFDYLGLLTQIIRIIDNFGFDHIAIRVVNDQGTWVYGFLPTVAPAGGLYSTGEYDRTGSNAFQYHYRQYNADIITLNLTNEQEKKLGAYFDSFRMHKSLLPSFEKVKYSIVGGNVCTTEASESLTQVGLPRINSYRPVNFINELLNNKNYKSLIIKSELNKSYPFF